MEIQVEQVDRLRAIDRAAWNTLNTANNPFLQYDFLNGLEEHDCLQGHGWQPCHLTVKSNKELIAALPLYLRNNSYGEFVFDWSWADAYKRAGGQYYPKLVSAIPHTPVCGPRILIKKGVADAHTVRTIVLNAVQQIVAELGLSSWHCLFTQRDDQSSFMENNLLLRKTIQFHWVNKAFESFDEFLSTLTAKRRKQIKRERRQVRQQDIHIERITGADISEQQWEVFYDFYCSTFYKRWGSPRLTLNFFKSLSENLPEQTLLILAQQGQGYVAGAFSMFDENTLYGRHWGCSQQIDNLHFELCYYQTIEHCIEQKLKRVDAGVQGEHKVNRGFEAIATVSAHLIKHPNFRRAISDFLDEETKGIERYITSLQEHSPYKQVTP